jgi:hypothetical protein
MTKKDIDFCKVCADLYLFTCYTKFVNPNTLFSFLLHPISNKIPSPKKDSSNCPFLRIFLLADVLYGICICRR